jgi:nicotinamide-nucleotide amidase
VTVQALIDAARLRHLRIATAESCTAGMISAAIADIAGASDVLACGFVTYSNQAKETMLGVRARTLATYGAVSEQVASEMAEGALNAAQVDLAVSVTGVAGPGGTVAKPEGRVCFGLARRGADTFVETVEFGPLGRNAVRKASTEHALMLLLRAAQA